MAETDRPDPSYIRANGLEFAYLGRGDANAPLVLCLHGFPDSAASFVALMDELASNGFRAVAVFMRGYAPTAIPDDHDYSVLALGRDVLALIEHFRAERAFLVGHDWGAVAAYAAAFMRPDRVRGIAAAAAPHPRRFLLRPSRAQLHASRYMLRFQWPGADRNLRADDFAGLASLIAQWSPGWEPSPDFINRFKELFSEPARLRAALAYYRAIPGLLFRREAWNYLLQPMQVPVRLLYGAQDGAVLPSTFAGQAHLYAGGYEPIEMPCGHFMHLERPDLFARHVIDFLQE